MKIVWLKQNASSERRKNVKSYLQQLYYCTMEAGDMPWLVADPDELVNCNRVVYDAAVVPSACSLAVHNRYGSRA